MVSTMIIKKKVFTAVRVAKLFCLIPGTNLIPEQVGLVFRKYIQKEVWPPNPIKAMACAGPKFCVMNVGLILGMCLTMGRHPKI